MANKVGQVERKFKLNVFYSERYDSNHPITIKGLARAWASERWDHTTGDPYFYEFRITKWKDRISPEIQLKVHKCNGTEQFLGKKCRKDIRDALKERFQKYWWNNQAPMSDIPIANMLATASLIAKMLCDKQGAIPDEFQSNFLLSLEQSRKAETKLIVRKKSP